MLVIEMYLYLLTVGTVIVLILAIATIYLKAKEDTKRINQLSKIKLKISYTDMFHNCEENLGTVYTTLLGFDLDKNTLQQFFSEHPNGKIIIESQNGRETTKT